jgi:hypothetical protein
MQISITCIYPVSSQIFVTDATTSVLLPYMSGMLVDKSGTNTNRPSLVLAEIYKIFTVCLLIFTHTHTHTHTQQPQQQQQQQQHQHQFAAFFNIVCTVRSMMISYTN